MPDILQIKRGLKEHLPTEALEGELMLCTDTKELYVGINGEVKNVAMESDVVIDSNIPMPIAVGGLKKGTTFDKVLIQEVLMQMLYPYTAPIMSLTTNQSDLNETGALISETTCTIQITKTMFEISTVTLLKNGKKLQTWDHIIAPDFVTPITLIYSDSVFLGENTTYSLEVQDTSRQNQLATTIEFELPTFAGACINKVPTASEIDTVTKMVRRKAPFSHTFTTNNERMMVIYPKAWGELASIQDPNHFELMHSFNHSVITHITKAGANSYHAYVSNLTTLTNHKVNFIF